MGTRAALTGVAAFLAPVGAATSVAGALGTMAAVVWVAL